MEEVDEEKQRKLRKIFDTLEVLVDDISDYYNGVKVCFLPLPPPPGFVPGFAVHLRDPETGDKKYVFVSIEVEEATDKPGNVTLRLIEYTGFIEERLKLVELKKQGVEMIGEILKKEVDKKEEEKQKHYT